MGTRIKAGIYQWMNEINGKSYIGSSKDLNGRKCTWLFNFKNKMTYRCLLKLAVQKYGVENFTFIILEECEPAKEILEAKENHYLDTLKPEYNILKKAYIAALGRIQSEEERSRRRGRICTEETRQKLRAVNLGKTMSEESNQKNREAHLGKPTGPASEERKIKIGNANRGRIHTAETRAKNRAAKMGQVPWNKGGSASDEARLKMSLAKKGKPPHNKGKSANPDAIARMLATKAKNRANHDS